LLQCTTALLTKNTLFGIDSLVSVGKELGRRSPPLCPVIPKSVVSTPSHACDLPKPQHHHRSREQFANLARTWIELADDSERTLAFLEALNEETEPQRRTG
jgi:hypothetical protein